MLIKRTLTSSTDNLVHVFFDIKKAKFSITKDSISSSIFRDIELDEPLVIGVQVTNDCFLNCSYCIAARNAYTPIVSFDRKTQHDLILRLQSSKVMAIWISGGEPTLWNGLPSLLKDLAKLNIGIVIDTNGISLSDTLLNYINESKAFLRFSIDGPSGEIHNSTRGGFELSFKNLLKAIRRGINVGVSTVITSKNIHCLNDFHKLLIEIGVFRWTLLELRTGFAPIFLQPSFDEIRSNLYPLLKNQSGQIEISFVPGNLSRSSFIVAPNGEYFTSEPKFGTSYVLGSLKTHTLKAAFMSKNIDKVSHLKKYLFSYEPQ